MKDNRRDRVGATAAAVVAALLTAYSWAFSVFFVVLLFGLTVIIVAALPAPQGEFNATFERWRVWRFGFAAVAAVLLISIHKATEELPGYTIGFVGRVIEEKGEGLAPRALVLNVPSDEDLSSLVRNIRSSSEVEEAMSRFREKFVDETVIPGVVSERGRGRLVVVPVDVVSKHLAGAISWGTIVIALALVVALAVGCFALFMSAKFAEVGSLARRQAGQQHDEAGAFNG